MHNPISVLFEFANLGGTRFMLRALTQNNESVYAWEGRKGVPYYCPHCESSLIFKEGLVKIKHFAHKTKTSCPYSENESKEHLLMKERIYKMIKAQHPVLSIELEKNLIPNRRADIVLRGKRTVVVECQVSPLTLREIKERTEDYNQLGYHVLWIYHLKRLKLSAFEQKISKVRFPEDVKLLNEYDSLFAMDDNGIIKKVRLVYETESSGRYRFSTIPKPIQFHLHETVKNYYHYKRTKETMWLCQLGSPSRNRVECYCEIDFQKDLDYFERWNSWRKHEDGWIDDYKKSLSDDLSKLVGKVEIPVLNCKDAAESQRFVFLAYSPNGWEGFKNRGNEATTVSPNFRGSNGFYWLNQEE